MKKRRLLVLLLMLFVAVNLIAFLLIYGCRSYGPPSMPAPTAPTAPRWQSETQPDGTKPPEKTPPQTSESTSSVYDLPLVITIEDVPEVPEKIKGPSPPIDESAESNSAPTPTTESAE
jgi:hypothetical protein